jgi:hypothetical protein
MLSWIDPGNPRPGICLLEVLAYERLALNSLEVLRNQVIPSANGFPVLNGQFMIALTYLCGCHRKWLNGLEEILKTGNRSRIGDFIMAFGEVSEVCQAERAFRKQATAIALIIVKASIVIHGNFPPSWGTKRSFKLSALRRAGWEI